MIADELSIIFSISVTDNRQRPLVVGRGVSGLANLGRLSRSNKAPFSRGPIIALVPAQQITWRVGRWNWEDGKCGDSRIGGGPGSVRSELSCSKTRPRSADATTDGGLSGKGVPDTPGDVLDVRFMYNPEFNELAMPVRP